MRIASCSFSGRFGKYSSAHKVTVDIISRGVRQEYSFLFLILPFMIIIIVRMLVIFVEAYIYGTISMDHPKAILLNMGLILINKKYKKQHDLLLLFTQFNFMKDMSYLLLYIFA